MSAKRRVTDILHLLLVASTPLGTFLFKKNDEYIYQTFIDRANAGHGRRGVLALGVRYAAAPPSRSWARRDGETKRGDGSGGSRTEWSGRTNGAAIPIQI